jgi:hypothetical protein
LTAVLGSAFLLDNWWQKWNVDHEGEDNDRVFHGYFHREERRKAIVRHDTLLA